MIFLIIFLFGLIIGSFLNVVILRYNSGESIIKGSSRCLSCCEKLKWHELIPLFSFLIQKGRCQKCSAKISAQYPLVEFITGIIFILIFNKFWNQINLIPFPYFFIVNFKVLFFIASSSIFFCCLLIITVYDIRHKIIPSFFSSFLIIFGISYLFISWMSDILRMSDVLLYILSSIVFAAFFFLLSFVSGEKWMGYGDSKLALGIGLFLGPTRNLTTFLFSFWIGAIFGIFILLFSKKFSLKSQIPFAPFLALGAFISFLIEINLF